MDLGLGNLADVKNFVLPALYLENGDTQYDSVLATIASGIADRFNVYTNRRLGWAVNDTCTFSANRNHYYLPRYPFTTLASLQMRAIATDPWADVTDAVIQMDENIGLIDFYVILADEMSLLKATWTGGYWYNTLEPTDEGYPQTLPEGATPLPASIKGAWLSQCLHEFQLKDQLLPDGLASGAQKSRLNWRLDQAVLLPEVQNAIEQFRRYQIT